ncbi:MAG TPA: MoxR family ATPase, partial [Longimicrobiales bacterium]|nr:MoxR family ATPase [Longimicrobiales bacterium]
DTPATPSDGSGTPSDPAGAPADPAGAASPPPGPPAPDPPPPADPLDPDALETSLEMRLLAPLGTVVQGQPQVLRQVAVTLLARGHALLEGVPGTGKTLAVRALARAVGLDFGRVQFTPDLMPTDLVGVSVLDRERSEFSYRPGPVFTDLLLADEINRAPAKTQAALLEAMEERQVTVDGVSRPLPTGFTVFATQNPVDFEGTYPLPEAQLDRFLMKIVVDYPSEAAEAAVLTRYAEGFRSEDPASFGIGAPLGRDELEDHRAAVDRVHVDERIRTYINHLVRATRNEPVFALGASPRAGVALFLACRAEAHLAGRDFVTPDDVRRLAFPVLRHRVLLTPDAEVEGRSADDELRSLLETLEAPR